MVKYNSVLGTSDTEIYKKKLLTMNDITNRSKTIVIIPAYEPSHAFVDYAKLLLAKGFGGLVVVDDGSGEKYADVFAELSALELCTVISYVPNHGKGYALKTAFKHCKENYGEEYVFVTADCDDSTLRMTLSRLPTPQTRTKASSYSVQETSRRKTFPQEARREI